MHVRNLFLVIVNLFCCDLVASSYKHYKIPNKLSVDQIKFRDGLLLETLKNEIETKKNKAKKAACMKQLKSIRIFLDPSIEKPKIIKDGYKIYKTDINENFIKNLDIQENIKNYLKLKNEQEFANTEDLHGIEEFQSQHESTMHTLQNIIDDLSLEYLKSVCNGHEKYNDQDFRFKFITSYAHHLKLNSKTKKMIDDGQWLFFLKNENFVEFLLELGADVNQKRHIDGWNLLHQSVQYNCIDIVKLLIKYNIDLDVKADDSFSPLYIAVNSNYLDMVKLLVDNGADIHKNNYLLHLAVINNNIKIVDFLITKGANVNESRIIDGFAPLHIAIFFCKYDMVKLLVNKGANINQKNSLGSSSLHQAIENYNPYYYKIVEFLITKNPDFYIQNKKGQTPLDIASNKNLVSLIEILKNHMNKK